MVLINYRDPRVGTLNFGKLMSGKPGNLSCEMTSKRRVWGIRVYGLGVTFYSLAFRDDTP